LGWIETMRLALLFSSLTVMATRIQAQEVFVGSFTTSAHLVAGDVYALSDQVLEVRNFIYDGEGPAAFFWADTTPAPTSGGMVLPDPSSDCGESKLPAFSNTPVVRVEFPPGSTIRDYLGGSLSVWCVTFAANFGDLSIAANLDLSSLPTTANGPALQCSEPVVEVFVGSFTTSAHLVAGDVYALSDQVLEVRNFIYDGEGPAAFFWADTTPAPTSGGMVLPDPSSDCGEGKLPAFSNTPVVRVEFPPGSTIRDYLGGSLSVWCVTFAANFGDLSIAANLDLSSLPTTANGPALQCSEPVPEVPPIAQTPEGYNCEPLNDDYQVRWQVDENQQEIAIELVANIPVFGTYMGFGISGSTTETSMDGADTIVAVSCSNTSGFCVCGFFFLTTFLCSYF
jgi:hypothetical protein